MKKILIFLLLPILSFSQFRAGRYIIKQAVTNFSIRSQEFRPEYGRIEPTCEDYKVNCGDQIFDIIPKGEFYFIKLVCKNLYLSLDGPNISNYNIRFTPKKPTPEEFMQLFSIIQNANGSYYIKPKLENNANYYVGTRMDLYPEYGSELQFYVKQQDHLPREYNDFRNVSWTFFTISIAAIPKIPTTVFKNPIPRKLVKP